MKTPRNRTLDIQTCERRLIELKEETERYEALSDAQRLAIKMHDEQCSAGGQSCPHWKQEDSLPVDEWQQHHHKEWLDFAQTAIDTFGYETCIKIIDSHIFG